MQTTVTGGVKISKHFCGFHFIKATNEPLQTAIHRRRNSNHAFPAQCPPPAFSPGVVRVAHAALAVRGHRRVLAAVPAAGRAGAAGLVVPAAAGAGHGTDRGQEREEGEGAARAVHTVHGGHRQPHLRFGRRTRTEAIDLSLHPLHSPVSPLDRPSVLVL